MNTLQFGSKHEGVDYFDRPGAYAVILNGNREIGIVEHNGHYFLPGGGIEEDENEIQALHREIREETGLEVKIERHLGNANEFQRSFDKKTNFNQIGYFYECSVITDHKDQLDLLHVFKWVRFEDVKEKPLRESHEWALDLAMRIS